MLTVDNLSCSYAGRPLFAAVSFFIEDKETVLLQGINGIGKTSLLRTVAGLPVPHTGVYTRTATAFYLSYHPPLNPHLTVNEQVTFWERLYQKTFPKKNFFLLDHQKNTLCAKLSAGQRQILSISRLLLTPAKLWLLDEPTTALDSTAITHFYQIVAEHKEKGGSCLIATHQALTLPSNKTIVLQHVTKTPAPDFLETWG